MEKYFNIAGPCFPTKHYMLPALDRMPEIRRLVDQEMYFVIHAPCQPRRRGGHAQRLVRIRRNGVLCRRHGLGYADAALPPLRQAARVFDADKTKPWDEKIYTRDEICNGKTIHVIGL